VGTAQTREALGRRESPYLTVAVVVPCHNYGHFLAEAIRSVLDQSRPADEILVVDDRSTDNTEVVAREFGREVGYIRINGGGPSAARNAGAKVVKTDLVVFLDADDRLDPMFLERCIEAMPEDWSRHFVYTHFQRFGASEAVSIAPPYDRDLLARENYIHPASLLPREQVARIGYDERLTIGLEDWDLYLTLAEEGIEGILVDQPLFLYRQHGDGVTWRLRRKPLRLAALRLRLLTKHRRLYSPSRAGVQVWSVLGLLLTDTEERYEVRRRSRKLARLVAGPANRR
jgi:glycosyltransferase involved in cell wall biosynthesis